MSNLMNKIGIDDKNGTPIGLGDKLRVISNDFEGQLILNEKGNVCFDEVKNIFYLQKERGQILLSEKHRNNYTIVSRNNLEVKSIGFVAKLLLICFLALLTTMFLIFKFQ